MSVGIMDGDIMKYTLVPFNLEAMKIASYYKKRHEMVLFAPEFTPERHQKFIYRQDYYDGEFPKGLQEDNVEYGGLAFTNNVYQPLPLAIERCQPDAEIYARISDEILGNNSKIRQKIYNNMLDAEHCRLSLDGRNIWDDYERQFKFLPTARNLMFHDYDLGAVKGSFEEVQRILSRARTDGWATKVGMKFPVNVSDGQSLLNWSSLNTNSTFYSLAYNGVIERDAFVEWVGRCRQKAVFTQMDYNITSGPYEPHDFVMNQIPEIFKQVIISRSYYVFFTLKYEEDFFPDPMWCEVIRLINFYHNSYAGKTQAKFLAKIGNDTMFDFVKHACEKPTKYAGKVMKRSEMREVFAFVRDNNPELFDLFYNCNANKLEGRL